MSSETRLQMAELTLQIRKLAHRGWEDKPNIEWLFREIGNKAQKLAALIQREEA